MEKEEEIDRRRGGKTIFKKEEEIDRRRDGKTIFKSG